MSWACTMRNLVALFLVVVCLAAPSACTGLEGMTHALSRFLDGVLKSKQANENATHWALLIAGSGGYGNYRHQADVAHSYQVMRAGGLKPEHIVVMMADDVAYSVENPYPGELYNRPGGPNVYKDLKPDYTGFKVTAQNFLAVLAGDQSALEPDAAGGPVISSGPNDLVFVYYADHGAPGILGMPWGPFLYADQLINTLEKKAKANAFKEMVLFIEACESGSMFEGLLNSELPIYVTTAANAHESSWGTYCPGMAPSPPAEFTTCLGDLYSVAWLEEVDQLIENTALDSESLKVLYKNVKQRTSNNFTYSMGSHVMQYGNLKIAGETLDGWLEEELSPNSWAKLFSLPTPSSAAQHNTSSYSNGNVIPARQAELVHLLAKAHTLSGMAQEEVMAAAQAMVEQQSDMDVVVRKAINTLLSTSNAFEMMQLQFADQPINSTGQQVGVGVTSLTEDLVTRAPPAAASAGKAVVEDWECLRGMVNAWERTCGPLDGYTMQYTRAFANLCNFGFNAPSLSMTLEPLCSKQHAAVA